MKINKIKYKRLIALFLAGMSLVGINARGIVPNHPLMPIGNSEPGPVINASGNSHFGPQQQGGWGNNGPGGQGMNQGMPGPGGGGWNNPMNPGWGGANPFAPTPFNNPLNNPAAAPVNYIPAPVINTNQGVAKVIGCGYDATGVWRIIPMLVSYQYNGVVYDVNVLNAWNPWTQSWDKGVDMPAFSTDYYLRGMEFSYYSPLSTGTYYFNL